MRRTRSACGALRLLPTLGPTCSMTRFPFCSQHAVIRRADIWESSRFCIDPEISQDRASNQVTVAAAELMCAVGELGLASGIRQIVTVTDVFLERMFRRMGCPDPGSANRERSAAFMPSPWAGTSTRSCSTT